MTTATARIPVLVTERQKTRITKMAKKAGLTMGEFFRRAAESYRPADQEDILMEGLIQQVLRSTASAERAMSDALAFVAASERRMRNITSNKRI